MGGPRGRLDDHVLGEGVMGQPSASMRKWLRRAKFALDHCWCGAPLRANFHTRLMECPNHGEAKTWRSSPDVLDIPLSESEHFERSGAAPLRVLALTIRAEHRTRRRSARGCPGASAWAEGSLWKMAWTRWTRTSGRR